ncbi:MAG: histidine phosphatase family protein [Proteobacteria bacterium]|nr:histidine phosphatase family protein [Pseudomonadota bacterium]MBU1741266.1 histidine phosphatase family protein [Pseudomonadota bacterium]
MGAIYFIRHGQASFTNTNYDRLSEKGVRQSELLGDYLRHLGLCFNEAFSGTLERQKDTARAVLGRLSPGQAPRELRIEADLDEHNTVHIARGQFAELTEREPALLEDIRSMFTDNLAFKRVYQRVMLRWMAGRFSDPNLETYPQFLARVERITRKLMASEAENIIVFTSGGPISTVMRLSLGLSDEKALALTWRLRNASVSAFDCNPERISLVVFNQVAHLETQGDADLITYR